MKNIGIILAGGSGSRFGKEIPKQFLRLKGKEVLLYSIETFLAHEDIDKVAVVVNKNYVNKTKALVKNLPKPVEVITGGKERYESSLNAIKHYSPNNCNIIFHDAARPLISKAIISKIVESLKIYKAVTVATPSTDTILVVDEEFKIKDIPNRNLLYNCQTPQGFSFSLIEKAYEIALKDKDFCATDDCGVIKKYLSQEPIYVVQGEPANMKLTYEKDIITLESFL